MQQILVYIGKAGVRHIRWHGIQVWKSQTSNNIRFLPPTPSIRSRFRVTCLPLTSFLPDCIALHLGLNCHPYTSIVSSNSLMQILRFSASPGSLANRRCATFLPSFLHFTHLSIDRLASISRIEPCPLWTNPPTANGNRKNPC